jgi:hypothetical protein
VNKPEPDLSPLLPDEATVKARRTALVDAVGARGEGPRRGGAWRRRGPRLALGAAVVVAAVAVVSIVAAGGDNPPAAFAVEPQPGGGVRIEVYSHKDASGLEKALEAAGIRAQVNWLPAGKTCEPDFTPSKVRLPGGGTVASFAGGGPGALTISIGSTQRWRESFGKLRRGETSGGEIANFNLDPAAFRPDQSVILFGSPVPFRGDPEGGFQARFEVAEGPVGPCGPLPAPATSIGAIKLPPGGGAAGGTGAGAPPGPGQFLYTKTRVVQLQGWEPDGRGAGPRSRPRHFTANLLGPEGEALPALVSTLKEVWISPQGKTRERETLGGVRFLSAADQRRWEGAGSPPPFAYDPAEHEVQRDGSGRLVKEFASRSWRGKHEFANLPKLSRLPTEPEALRLAIENRSGGSAPVEASPADSERGAVTAERLWEILVEPLASPALRAAAFNALAEIPGIKLERNVADVAGRRGEALTWVRERGFGRELIFDPHTSQVLAQAEMIFGAPSTHEYGVPADTVFRETAYLESEVVDSAGQRPAR